jgi:outer membrane protein assembly factor BamB
MPLGGFALTWTLLGCAIAAGCAPAGDDIVAHLTASKNAAPDASSGAGVACCGVANGAPLAGTATSDPNACAAQAYPLVIVTKDGAIYRVQPETGKVDKRGIPACFTSGVFAAAVDVAGNIWAVAGDGNVWVIDPESLRCDQRSLQLKPSAMAFVYDAGLKQQLYVLEGGTLIVVNPETLTRSPIGQLDARALTGTADGTLYAFTELGVGTLMVSRVEPGNAALVALWKAAEPANLALMGGAAAPSYGAFALIFERSLYVLRTPSSDPAFVAQLFSDDSYIVAVSSSPCAWLTK